MIAAQIQFQAELLRFQIVLAFSVKNCQKSLLEAFVKLVDLLNLLDFLEIVELADLLSLLDLVSFQSKLEIPTYISEINQKFSRNIYNLSIDNLVKTSDNMIQFMI